MHSEYLPCFYNNELKSYQHDLDTICHFFMTDAPLEQFMIKYGDNILKKVNFKRPSINLINNDGSAVDDIIAVKTIFDSMKNLPADIASQAGLWSAWCMCPELWPYVRKRWGLDSIKYENKEKFIATINQRVFVNRNMHTRHSIGRLWWIGKMTYDQSLSDPYQITRFVLSNQDRVISILERNQGRCLDFLRALCFKITELENDGFRANTDFIRSICAYINARSAGILIDSATEKVGELIDAYIQNIYKPNCQS